MACDGLVKRLSEGKSAEVKGGTPAILVKIGRKVVITKTRKSMVALV